MARSATVPSPSTVVAGATTNDLKGLRGWLIVLGFRLIVSVMAGLYTIISEVHRLSEAASAPHQTSVLFEIPGYPALLKFGVVTSLLFLVVDSYAAILFFHKSRMFPRFYLVLLVASSIHTAVDYELWSHALAGASRHLQALFGGMPASREILLASSVAVSILWCLYILMSKRVKATFVN